MQQRVHRKYVQTVTGLRGADWPTAVAKPRPVTAGVPTPRASCLTAAVVLHTRRPASGSYGALAPGRRHPRAGVGELGPHGKFRCIFTAKCTAY